MTGIQRYYIEEVDIVVEDEKGVAVEQAVARVVKKAARQIWDRKPAVETLIVRI